LWEATDLDRVRARCEASVAREAARCDASASPSTTTLSVPSVLVLLIAPLFDVTTAVDVGTSTRTAVLGIRVARCVDVVVALITRDLLTVAD
jgi:hypothetical protein